MLPSEQTVCSQNSEVPHVLFNGLYKPWWNVRNSLDVLVHNRLGVSLIYINLCNAGFAKIQVKAFKK